MMHNDVIPQMRAEVAAGLSLPQKELPPKYFYDAHGSRLFEEITRLPEYYLTRAERVLLERTVPEVISYFRPRSLTELGAGGAEKTRIILDAMRDIGSAAVYQPIDVSAAFLAGTADRLRAEYPGLRVQPLVADFTGDLRLDGALEAPHLYAFLGSTIGNLDPNAAARLLTSVRAALSPVDRLLLGVDLKKDVARLEAAYNDASGVTAEFNHNVLLVLNRELGADFDVAAFQHRAFYNQEADRIEMHLVSIGRQRVMIPGVGTFDFQPGESVRTEISYKYDRARIEMLFGVAHLGVEHWWADDDALFALVLAAPR